VKTRPVEAFRGLFRIQIAKFTFSDLLSHIRTIGFRFYRCLTAVCVVDESAYSAINFCAFAPHNSILWSDSYEFLCLKTDWLTSLQEIPNIGAARIERLFTS